jgi:hypothetical protein
MTSKNIQSIIENIVSQDRFNLTPIKKQIPLFEEIFIDLQFLKKEFSEKIYEYVICSLIRNVFLIELVNDDINSTKMETRWNTKPSTGKKQEVFDTTDPRFASFNECVIIFKKLVSDLKETIDDDKNKLLCKYQEYRLIPYELPIDYVKKNGSRLHYDDNLKWFWDEEYQNTIKLRSVLMTLDGHSKIFLKMLKDKVKVKTYLTDRVQTGNHKTNREKRWETHPNSVHFALRKDCLLIEKELISQVLNFNMCPDIILESTNNLVEKTNTYCCPVTLDFLDFHEFVSEILEPTHGLSKFQVGHLNPLKSNSNDGKNTHSAQNIGWISDNGNRIQGSMSLQEVKDLLKRISKNYEDLE